MEGNVFAKNDELLRKFDTIANADSPQRAPPSPDSSATVDYFKKQVALLKDQLSQCEERLGMEKSNSIFLKGQLQAARKQLKKTTQLVSDMQSASSHHRHREGILPAVLLLTNTSDASSALTVLRSWKEVYSHSHTLHSILSSALNLDN